MTKPQCCISGMQHCAVVNTWRKKIIFFYIDLIFLRNRVRIYADPMNCNFNKKEKESKNAETFIDH